jgi:hypothetical protein
VRDLLPSSRNVRLIHLAQHLRIGEKRNYAASRAAGAAICHWDDDDWSEPGRIDDQVQRLKTCEVTGYHTMKFTDGGNWWKYTATPTYAVGTSLCYWKTWWQAHPFQTLNIGEDNAFVAEAAAAQKLVSVDGIDQMHATIHTGNSSPRVYGMNWTQIVWATSPS